MMEASKMSRADKLVAAQTAYEMRKEDRAKKRKVKRCAKKNQGFKDSYRRIDGTLVKSSCTGKAPGKVGKYGKDGLYGRGPNGRLLHPNKEGTGLVERTYSRGASMLKQHKKDKFMKAYWNERGRFHGM